MNLAGGRHLHPLITIDESKLRGDSINTDVEVHLHTYIHTYKGPVRQRTTRRYKKQIKNS
jgi:hypothetical protein